MGMSTRPRWRRLQDRRATPLSASEYRRPAAGQADGLAVIGASRYATASTTLTVEMWKRSTNPRAPLGASYGPATATSAQGRLLRIVEQCCDLTQGYLGLGQVLMSPVPTGLVLDGLERGALLSQLPLQAARVHVQRFRHFAMATRAVPNKASTAWRTWTVKAA